MGADDELRRENAALRERLLAAAGERPIDARNRALVAVAYDAMLRRSELTDLQVADLVEEMQGDASLIVRRGKTDPEGRGAAVYLARDTVALVREWQARSGVESGRLFRSLSKGGAVGTRLHPSQIPRIFKAMAHRAGLPPEIVAGLSGHSARVGAAQDMVASGIEMPAILQAGRWKTTVMVSWEAINRTLLEMARASGVETGDRVRIDSTVTETHILEPSDSRLLFDGVRVLTRLLGQAREELGAVAVDFHDRCRAAKRRALEAGSQRGAERRAKTYRKLLKLTGRTVGYVEAALPAVVAAEAPWSRVWVETATAYLELLGRVTEQTERRVFGGETVPAGEKVVSLFEPHTDIIVKGGRGTHYGHKINLATGRSGLVFDVVVEDGNPADSARPPAVGRCLPMLGRHIEHYGVAPSRAAFDGGYASRENLKAAKALGIEHVVFHKKRGLKVEDMTRSSWLYGQLKRFRAGVEAGISYLKRCFGLGRCLWRGLPRFKAYVQSAVFAHNLMRLVRLHPKPA